MAELGVINYTNVNQGTRQVDRSAESRGIGQILDTGKKLVDEKITSNVTGEMMDTLNEAVANSTVEELGVQEVLPGSREEYLSNRMDKLTNVIKQGSKSQQTAAELQIQGILAEAQTKYPWLAENLRQKAGAIVSGSVQMTRLGIDDSLRNAQATAAQDEFEAIVDHARKDWKDGGLGLPEELDPRSAVFMAEYAKRQQLRDEEETSMRTMGMALANARLDMYGPGFQKIDEALSTGATWMRNQYTNILHTRGWDQALKAAGKEDADSIQFIDNFQTNTVLPIVSDLEVLRSDMRDTFNATITPEMQQTDKGKILKQRFDDQLAEIDAIIGLLNTTRDNLPTAIQAVDRMLAVRNARTFAGLPEAHKDFAAWMTTPMAKNYIDLANTWNNPAGAEIRRDLGLAAQSSFAHWNPLFGNGEEIPNPLPGDNTRSLQDAAYYNSTGALKIPPGAGPDDIRRRMDQRFRDPNNTWVMPGTGEELQVQMLENLNTHERLYDLAVNMSKDASPEFANQTLLGQTYSLAYANGDSIKPKNIETEVLKHLATPAVRRAIEKASEGGDLGPRRAWGLEAEEYYLASKPDEIRQSLGSLYRNKRIGASDKTLAHLVKLDLDSLKKGEFNYVVDKDQLRQAAEFALGATPSLLGVTTPGKLEGMERNLERKIADEMIVIENTMRQQINTEINIAMAKGSSRDPDFFQFFAGEGDPTGTGNAWIDNFNYTR